MAGRIRWQREAIQELVLTVESETRNTHHIRVRPLIRLIPVQLTSLVFALRCRCRQRAAVRVVERAVLALIGPGPLALFAAHGAHVSLAHATWYEYIEGNQTGNA